MGEDQTIKLVSGKQLIVLWSKQHVEIKTGMLHV